MAKNLRQQMPLVTQFIDDLRAAFGADVINAAIRAGIAGQQTFWASENGHQVGTRSAPASYSVCSDDMYLRHPKTVSNEK